MWGECVCGEMCGGAAWRSCVWGELYVEELCGGELYVEELCVEGGGRDGELCEDNCVGGDMVVAVCGEM